MIVDIITRWRFRAWEYMVDDLHVPPKVVRAALYRDVNRGLLDYGVCVERSWLTDLGRASATPLT